MLVDVYGVGVLLTGESGVGKSEAALELVKRGHQLVADDVVDICRVSMTASPANARRWCGTSWKYAVLALLTYAPCTA